MQCHALHNPPVSSMWISCGLSHTRMQTHTHTHTPLLLKPGLLVTGKGVRKQLRTDVGGHILLPLGRDTSATPPRFHLNLTLDRALCVWVGRRDGGDGQALCQQGKHS